MGWKYGAYVCAEKLYHSIDPTDDLFLKQYILGTFWLTHVQ